MPRVTARTTRKPAAKKTTARKTTARTTTKRRTAAVKKAAPRAAKPAAPAKKATAIRDPYTKAQLMTALADNTGMAKKDVATVMEELNSIIERHIRKRGAGQFSLPGLMKIRTVRKPATKARKGRNPFTGEDIMIKAKPARTAVKVTALKGLKEMTA